MSTPPRNLPVVLKQSWIVVLPDGRTFDAGSSYHLTEESRNALVSEVASRLSTDMEGEREEPIGDPFPIHTTPEYHEKIKNSPHGLRVK